MPSALENLCGPNKPLKAEPPDAREFVGLVRAATARLNDASFRLQRVLDLEQLASVELPSRARQPIAAGANPPAEAHVGVFCLLVVEAAERSGHVNTGQFLQLACGTADGALPHFDERLSFEQTRIGTSMPQHAAHGAFRLRHHSVPEQPFVLMDI